MAESEDAMELDDDSTVPENMFEGDGDRTPRHRIPLASIKPRRKSNTNPPEIRRELRSVDDLQAHPLHGVLPLTSKADDDGLRDELRSNGQLEPIEILPDGTILSGHRRWQAIQSLGWPQVEVIVRSDLGGRNSQAAARRFFQCNLSRRHFTRLEKARVFQSLMEYSPSGKDRRGMGNIRDEIGRILGMSGRNLERWLMVLGLPPEIGTAVERRELPLARAVELASTHTPTHFSDVVKRIQGGESPRAAVDAVLGPVRSKKSPANRASRFPNWLRSGREFADCVKSLRKGVTDDDCDSIRELITLLRSLLPEKPDRARQERPPRRESKRKPR